MCEQIMSDLQRRFVTFLYSVAGKIEGNRERKRRGACPECGGMLTKQKTGFFRCDDCRKGKG